jgi:hypothetical protein
MGSLWRLWPVFLVVALVTIGLLLLKHALEVLVSPV